MIVLTCTFSGFLYIFLFINLGSYRACDLEHSCHDGIHSVLRAVLPHWLVVLGLRAQEHGWVGQDSEELVSLPCHVIVIILKIILSSAHRVLVLGFATPPLTYL